MKEGELAVPIHACKGSVLLGFIRVLKYWQEIHISFGEKAIPFCQLVAIYHAD